jgi:hypothetical protein
LTEPVEPAVATLAARAVEGRLVICGGAGLSHADPSELPLGRQLANLVFDALAARLGGGAMTAADRDELLSVADTVEQEQGGDDLLQTTLAGAADYTTAEPNYGHEMLAILILEGAVECIVTNYDDCIERGCPLCGRLQAIISNADRATVTGAAVLKAQWLCDEARKPLGFYLSTSRPADVGAPSSW